MRKGFLYLVAIMDWFTRKVLAWRISNTLEADFCLEALNEAIHKFGPPEIMNTDQGSQFTSFDWTVIPPFLTGCSRRTYAAIFSFMAGVMPPMPMFGRSLLYVQSHCVAKSWASSMLSMMYWSSHSCRTVRL
jgi:hypothetical protein